MASLIQNVRNKAAYRRARRQAGPDETVCATLAKSGEPVYFVMPVDASDADVWQAAFEHREGRPPTRIEKTLVSLARLKESDA